MPGCYFRKVAVHPFNNNSLYKSWLGKSKVPNCIKHIQVCRIFVACIRIKMRLCIIINLGGFKSSQQ